MTSGGGYTKGIVVAAIVFIVAAIAIIFIAGLVGELRARASLSRERLKAGR